MADRPAGPPSRPVLDALIRRSIADGAAMTPDAIDAMMREQARSYARGEAGFGSDADEARYRIGRARLQELYASTMRRKEFDESPTVYCQGCGVGQHDNGVNYIIKYSLIIICASCLKNINDFAMECSKEKTGVDREYQDK